MRAIALRSTLDARVRMLQARFRAIAAGPMRDLPLNHPGLPVEAIGFEPDAADPDWALGVLLTPWCMNLVRLPCLADAATLAVGHKASRTVGDGDVTFIGAFDEAIGGYETCSLFSPMQAFADASSARDTAREVLAELRRPVVAAPPAASERPAAPSRRGFLFGLRGA
ncbi:[NiFe]-hydrogenase assembly chaperone HybE [Sphaerotilus mobilis]|uniref:[NiFe] hydrogenase assembly HybE family chaperone n=1 Tax=Sphaerotilus mobilis TaxID=47994 RepID=A0A4Q7LT95_9BURK|nr:[NiFe]-hydrogenase assembly chaperone HybE [Sphaerotilus mobilis]RZS57884.1 [NiFe] hydrogenase assembly HybE family chaperone [Sphaerotilus mobilis]